MASARERAALRLAMLATLLALTACNGFDTGMNPLPEMRKEQGPLVAPPPGVVRGTAN